MTPEDPRRFKPTNLAVAARELAVAWADGHESYYPFGWLRRECPCATCRARAGEVVPRNPLRVIEGPTEDEIAIRRLLPVGAYAVQIVWSDGHDTGIWAFEALRRACACGECSAAGAAE